MGYGLSQICSHSQVRPSHIKPPIAKTMPDRTSRPRVSGGRDDVDRVPSLTSGCSTRMHPATVTPPQVPAIANMRERREGPMKRESARWSMAPLHHWCFQPLEAWVLLSVGFSHPRQLVRHRHFGWAICMHVPGPVHMSPSRVARLLSVF